MRSVPLTRIRTVAAVGGVLGAYFALRNAGVLFCVQVLHMEASAGAATVLAAGAALLLLLAFHSVGNASTEEAGLRISLWRSPVTRWLAAYLVFVGASLLWSSAVSPLSSSAYWVGLLVDALTLVLLLSRYPPHDVAGSVLSGYLLAACVVGALAWLLPAQKDLRLGDPDFLNTNQIANVCAFGIFFAQYLDRRGLRWIGPPIIFLSITLLRTLSKTTLLAFLLSQGVLLFRDPNLTPRNRRRILLCAAAVLLASYGLMTSYYDVYIHADNQAETLTGRTAIWAWAFDKLPDSLWIGHGFDSMWKVMPPFGIDYFEARHAENEVLQQLYAYGAVGTALFAGVYFSLFRVLRRSAETKIRPILKALLLFILLRGLAEAEPFDLLLPAWVLLLLAGITIDARDRTA